MLAVDDMSRRGLTAQKVRVGQAEMRTLIFMVVAHDRTFACTVCIIYPKQARRANEDDERQPKRGAVSNNHNLRSARQ